jgi:DNA polymerase-1
MAAQILHITYDDALAMHQGGDKYFKEIRTLGKAANFGFPGGLGAESFIAFARATYHVIVTYEQAVALKNDWYEALPEMRQYLAWIARLCESGSAWISQPMSGRCRGDLTFTACANIFFQGRTADGAKAALAEVARRQHAVPSSALYGTHTVAFIHDEIGIEAREDVAHEAAMELEKVMVEEFIKFHPDLVKAIAAKPSMSRRWYKEVPQVWKNERLIPWEDQQRQST